MRKIPFNPSAGEVHRREQGAPWRMEADEQIRQSNARAREEQAEKRRWGLAKQVQDGLVHSYGINYGIAELAALLKDGLAIRARRKAELSPSEVSFSLRLNLKLVREAAHTAQHLSFDDSLNPGQHSLPARPPPELALPPPERAPVWPLSPRAPARRLLRSPFLPHTTKNKKAEQMRFIHKSYCEAMEVGEEDLPIQLKMDDSFYPTYKPSVSDFDEHTFMRKMQDVVGLLRNPAEAIISSICAYQRDRYERFSFSGYMNDPRTLLLEEFKDWAMRTLAPASCTTESILNEVRRRHSYVLRLQHGQQGLFHSGSGERSLMGTLKDVRRVIETRVLPAIEAERAHSSAREQLQTLEARGTDGLMHGVQFLFYVLRNTPNTPADCTISNLQSQQHSGMKDAMQTKSGQLLQVLLTTPSFKTLFPEPPSTGQRDSLRSLQLTAEEEAEMEYSKDTKIVVPQQQIDYIFEFNYDGFFRQSTKDLEVLLTTFDMRRP
ncbi:hypothetical protein P43SY_006471 [Pythium insidiosum]|uniref:Uncharacterized protein n=1 Tax=Pythium insidiosum TaxID=114742 RepID=A0AAD5Q4Q1_PYTIN|nr:hypothetical protein P43SY_006471 [Pythium insidiosum]